MLVYLRLFAESFSFAINALRNNKLRTFLSLLGITIGIFSIIAVLAAVDSLDKTIKDQLSGLDKNTMYLARFSFGPTDVPTWKRLQFPEVSYTEYKYLKSTLSDAENMAFQLFVKRENISFESKSVNRVNTVVASHEFEDIQALKFSKGRFYSESESNSGRPVVVIGDDIANQLFGSLDPIGKRVRIYGQKFTVIGVVKKEGSGLFGDSNDVSMFLPANYVRNRFGDNNKNMNHIIIIKPTEDVDIDALKAEVTQLMRSQRGLKPDEIDPFFISVISGLQDAIDDIISTLNIIGWVISGFSLLVGGFGIANIMFVSVKERTSLIGIQKSLGAKNRFILFQFLFEAVILSILGGIVGIIMVWLVALAANAFVEDFTFVLSFFNIFLGFALSTVIGLISGVIPAISASKLDPVEAIRTGM
ncbi:FtsX-like permease family protein [Subsaximicrobium wynnwilliamsii]|uniref:FtsX-like permease family protein n=1 Tax=Subsaximicrobium wynnwilliamsii TaxID=291179 RepID=A0A5C6ZJW2_9FLAO|nr:ABC transporter permease [Subsaximicrobium wynnwilliamsii]TXD84564.1 FtsX-like permease family protein [Subsaximicrobium wynnwilliamsii]TXD90246.1 FtsX-like permease family protein [Subsaximicrobium wynnwilliamsii]TXE04297.1 FtsX-like permease family protein [Subsaximicrobium wynnwilliamsii]